MNNLTNYYSEAMIEEWEKEYRSTTNWHEDHRKECGGFRAKSFKLTDEAPIFSKTKKEKAKSNKKKERGPPSGSPIFLSTRFS